MQPSRNETRRDTREPSLPRRQRGAAAIEFALVFLAFFAVFYAIVFYGVIFGFGQTLTMAAEEGARAAVQDAATESDRLANASATVAAILAPIVGENYTATVSAAACSGNPAYRCVTVQLAYDYAAHPLVPALPLVGIAAPPALGASAVVQL